MALFEQRQTSAVNEELVHWQLSQSHLYRNDIRQVTVFPADGNSGSEAKIYRTFNDLKYLAINMLRVVEKKSDLEK